MSTLLKTIIAFAFSAMANNTALFAQCNVTTTQINNIENITSAHEYQYIRYQQNYFAISVNTTLVKNAAGPSLFSNIEYTYNKTAGHAEYVSFKFSDQASLKIKLTFAANKKNDNIKTYTTLYKLLFTDADIVTLKTQAISEVLISNKTGAISIPITNPRFLQSQISCVLANIE